MAEAWADWIPDEALVAQLHANFADPLGEGGMLHFCELARRAFEDRTPLGRDRCVVWGSLEPNRFREGLHINALVLGPPAARDVRRTEVFWELQERARSLHHMWTPWAQPDNKVSLQVWPVRPRGDGAFSLKSYIAKYVVKFEGRWFEVGDLGLYVKRAQQ